MIALALALAMQDSSRLTIVDAAQRALSQYPTVAVARAVSPGWRGRSRATSATSAALSALSSSRLSSISNIDFQTCSASGMLQSSCSAVFGSVRHRTVAGEVVVARTHFLK